MADIKIPKPLLTVHTEETWKDAGFTGFREYTCKVEMGGVTLFSRDADDTFGFVDPEEFESETVTLFAHRLKTALQTKFTQGDTP